MARFHRRRRTRRPRRRRRRMRRRRMVMDPERKFAGTSVETVVSNVGFRSILNGVPQTADENGRIGLQHLNVFHTLKYKIAINGTQGAMLRLSLVHYKQPNGVDLGLNTVWDSAGTGFAVLSQRILFNQSLFSILWTRTHRVDNGNSVIYRTKTKSMRITTRYDNSGNGTIVNILKGAIYLLVHSDQAMGTAPQITFTSRMRYVG